MHRTLKPYTGRTVIVAVDGDPLRGTLKQVDRAAIVLDDVTQADGARVDGGVIVPLPTVVQVV